MRSETRRGRPTAPAARLLVGLLLPVLGAACGGNAVPSASDTPCAVPTDVVRPDTGTVVVTGDEPPCTIAFRVVVTLRSEMEGRAARWPVALGPGGTYLTATYNPGEVAVWSPSGAFERAIGKGAGEGPGEFRRVQDLVVDTLRDRVYILPGPANIEVYTLEGEFLRRITVPGVPAVRAAVLAPDGALIATTPSVGRGGTRSPDLIVVRGDSITRAGPHRRSANPFYYLGPSRDGVWTFEPYWYELDHHVLPDGLIDFRIRREAPWVTEHTEKTIRGQLDQGDHAPSFMGAWIDEERGLAFALVMVADPDAPRPPKFVKAPNGELMVDPNAPRPRAGAYQDRVVEVVTLDGRLLASRRWDNAATAPGPITPDRWGLTLDDELRSIRILEPVLVKR